VACPPENYEINGANWCVLGPPESFLDQRKSIYFSIKMEMILLMTSLRTRCKHLFTYRKYGFQTIYYFLLKKILVKIMWIQLHTGVKAATRLHRYEAHQIKRIKAQQEKKCVSGYYLYKMYQKVGMGFNSFFL